MPAVLCVLCACQDVPNDNWVRHPEDHRAPAWWACPTCAKSLDLAGWKASVAQWRERYDAAAGKAMKAWDEVMEAELAGVSRYPPTHPIITAWQDRRR